MSSSVAGQSPAISDTADPLALHDVKSATDEGSDSQSSSQITTSLSRPPAGKGGGDMAPGLMIEARALVRISQCKQCSRPLRTPMTFPCGNSICAWCLPERHKRENITFPLMAGRREGFVCPFVDCRKEHSVADCAQDVTLTKVMDCLSVHISDFQQANPETPLRLDEKLRPPTELEVLQTEMVGSAGPEARTRTIDGGYLAATYTMAQLGDLRYDSDVEFSPQDPPNVQYHELDASLFATLKHHVRQELDCQLCWNILNDPLTTPCGHTFCRSCVARILDHSTACPVCRKTLHLPPGVQKEAGNKLLQKILETYCAEDSQARSAAIAAEREEANKFVPLFVCTLSYPGMPTFLHIFEPRYRLMIRRVLETESRTFGMAAYNINRIPQGDDLSSDIVFLRHGTLIRIVHAAQIPDGRMLIECVGVGRFDVRESREEDGYLVARTERIEDIGLEEEERLEAEEVQQSTTTSNEAGQQDSNPLAQLETASTAELLSISVNFVQRMRDASAPWLNSNILESYGEPPFDDPRAFTFWFASVLPFAEQEKYALIGCTSVRQRLKITAQWVKRIEAQGCLISSR